MKTKHTLLKFLVVPAMLLAGCNTGTTDENKEKQGLTGAAPNASELKQYPLSAGKQQSSQERAVQDTMGYNENCDSCNACDNSARWTKPITGGGAELTPDEARARVMTFHDEHGGEIICGGFISKVALDSIFCHHKNYNGVYCYIARDASGAQMMVVEGWADDDGHGQSRVLITQNDHVSGANKFRFFATELMCPTICGYAGD